MTLKKTALVGAFIVLGATAAAAQMPESGGSSTPGTATLAGPAQKAGASNQHAGGSMKKMKSKSHKKKM